MIASILDFIESRTGLVGGVREFFDEDIPASAGWPQVFGSVAMFCFLTQLATGLLLALNYAPTPGDAYQSVRYIMTEVTGGPIIRGLHHWGASVMIVVVGMHLAQVFLWGAYQKPREATWLVGVVLLLFTLAFGLTGYLLPWDNRAYWGTMVTTQIAASGPGGEHLSRLIGSEGGGVGVVTFARFYTLHVVLLPLVTVLLIGLHVFLVRKHGVAPNPGDTAPKKKFYPEQVFKDTLAIFAVFLLTVLLTATLGAPLGRMADPTDTSYIPRPEWYFLFLFQLLKFFEGPMEMIGTIVLPGLAVTTLILIPFIDRQKVARILDRKLAFAVFGVALLTWAGLTGAAIATTPAEAAHQDDPEPEVQAWQRLTPEVLAQQTAGAETPQWAVDGAKVYERFKCGVCHQANGAGMKVGPPLNGLHRRRTAEWVEQHFAEPQKLSPGSTMPPYRFKPDDLKSITQYVMSIPPDEE